jgi:large subunit ribosomal protein L25
MTTLKAEKRDLSVKPKKLRREGFVTGSIFGKDIDGSVAIMMDAHDTELALRTAGKGSKVVIELDGDKKNALIKEIQKNPLKNQLVEIDFQELVKGEMVNSVAEVVLENESSVKEGIVELVEKEIHYSALPESIVDKVVVNCAGLKIGDAIKVGDLDLAKDKNIKIKSDVDSVVVNVIMAKEAAVETETADADTAATTTAAE